MTGDAPETVIKPESDIAGVHEEQLEVAVTWMLPVPPAAPTLALSGFRLKVQGRAALAWKTAGAEDLFDEEQMASDLVNFLVTREVSREMASNLAADLLGLYVACRFLDADEALKQARLLLISATRRVLKTGLALLGVSAPEKM